MIIKNTTILDENFEIVREKDILIREGNIVRIGEKLSVEAEEEILEGKGFLFMPGLIDSHMHTGQQLLRGKVLDEMPMIWTRVMLPFESTLTEEKIRLSAKIAALEMIKSGTTGFVDAGSYFMESAAEVYEKSGLRGVLSYSTMDQKGLPKSIADSADSAIEKTDALFRAVKGKENLKVYYSLRSLISCSEELMEKVAARAREKGTMLQAHMNEYPGEINFFLESYGMRPYEFLEKKGILGGNFLGAHSLLLSENEMEILQERKVNICHCPFSNCGKAAPKTPQLLKRGISVGLGTDGTAHGGMSLWNEMKIFRSIINLTHGVPLAEPKILPAKEILKIVLQGGARALGEEGKIGVLKEGAKADLIGIDLMQPHLFPSGNLLNTLVESVNAGDVSHMIVGGKLLMKDKNVLCMDEEQILHEAVRYQKGESGW